MEAFIGSICAFGFNFAPYGWFECQGQMLPISQYTALFSLIGTSYGGNGTTNFALPNLQGLVAKGEGQGTGLQNYTLGETGGTATAPILFANMPQHTHNFNMTMFVDDSGNPGTTNNPNGGYLSSGTATPYYTSTPTGSNKMKVSASGGVTLTTDSTGSGATSPVSLITPTQVLNYCICNYGIFPMRN